MCCYCDIIERSLPKSPKNIVKSDIPLHRMLSELLEQGILTLYAGDCRFEDAVQVLNTERYYSVCFYLKCKYCGEIYFWGNCIRGPEKFRTVTDIAEENLEMMLWGREGEYFSRS